MNIDWNALGNWFAGFATVFAVIVALRLQRYYERRDRPSLSVGFDVSNKRHVRYRPPRFTKIADEDGDTEPGEREELWVRVAVENAGDVAAKDVQLRLVDIVREGDKFVEGRSNWWFKASGINSPTVGMLPRGIKQYFDIAYIRRISEPAHEVNFHLVIVKQELFEWPDERRRIETDMRNNRLDIGWTYSVHFAVLSSNADAVHYTMSLRVNPQRAKDPDATTLPKEDALRERLTLSTLSERVA